MEIVPDFRRRTLAVSLVVAHRGNLSRRVRAFMKRIEGVLTPHLEQVAAFGTSHFAPERRGYVQCRRHDPALNVWFWDGQFG